MQSRPITRSTSTSSVASIDGNANKRLRDETGSPLADDSVNNIADLWNRIQRMFADSNSKIEAMIESSHTKLENRIIAVESQLSALRTECTGSINQLALTVTEVQCEVQTNSLRVDHLERANDLIISGVPYTTNENLKQTFSILATRLEYQNCNLPMVDLKRLAKLPITSGATPPILCQFAFKNSRNEFYHRYLKTRNLTLRLLGFESDQRIYCNENLTQQARVIRTEAIKMKKRGSLTKVYTRNGVTFVQPADGTVAEPVYDVAQLFEKTKQTLSK